MKAMFEIGKSYAPLKGRMTYKPEAFTGEIRWGAAVLAYVPKNHVFLVLDSKVNNGWTNAKIFFNGRIQAITIQLEHFSASFKEVC